MELSRSGGDGVVDVFCGNPHRQHLSPGQMERGLCVVLDCVVFGRRDQSAGAANKADQKGSYFIVKALIYNNAGAANKTDEVVVWGKNTGTPEAPVWTTKEIAIPVPASTTWEDGKRYVYTFVFTTTGNGGYDPGTNDPVLTPITLQVDVDDFVDAGNKDVEMK